MSKMRYVCMKQDGDLLFVEMPASHAYQLTALNQRLHKEIGKLTAANVPALPIAIAECNDLDVFSSEVSIHHGLMYMNDLERSFAALQETQYPLVSLLTEIRALQAQLEQWYEEEEEGLH